MNNNEAGQPNKTRNPETDDARGGVIRPKGANARLFAGWGPRLMIAALAVAAIAMPKSEAAASSFGTPGASCRPTSRDAAVLKSPIPDMPRIATDEDITGEALIRVELSAAGSLQAASVAKSSGNASLDAEALRVARESQYLPAVERCQDVPSTYLYAVSFDS